MKTFLTEIEGDRSGNENTGEREQQQNAASAQWSGLHMIQKQVSGEKDELCDVAILNNGLTFSIFSNKKFVKDDEPTEVLMQFLDAAAEN